MFAESESGRGRGDVTMIGCAVERGRNWVGEPRVRLVGTWYNERVEREEGELLATDLKELEISICKRAKAPNARLRE